MAELTTLLGHSLADTDASIAGFDKCGTIED